MTEFYIPRSGVARLPDGRSFRLNKGIHPVPDALANHQAANEYGIKPVSEMTDDEYRMLGLETPAQKKAREDAVKQAAEAKVKADAEAAQKPAAQSTAPAKA